MVLAPRRAPKATVNETLRDRGIAHAVYLEKLKATEGRAILAHYADEVVPDLIEKLTARLARIEARGFDMMPGDTKRLQELLEVLQETVDAWTTGLAADLADKAGNIGVAEVAWQGQLFHSVLPIVWDTVIPSTAMVRAAVLNSPIDGVLLEDIVGRLNAQTKAGIEKAIRIGITEGESIPHIVSRLRKVTDFSGATAEAVARTAVGHASNMGRSSFYQENGDLIKGVQWHATLDTRTCPSCGALDGKLFPIDSGARPPRHISCRCTSVPVLRSMRELGLNIRDFDETTRASMNGQVPASTTFEDWIKKQPPSMQDEALGPTRAALLRTGKINVKDFVDPGGDLFNLDELKKREAGVFAAAGR